MAKNIAQLMVDTLVQAGAKRSAFPKTHSLVRTEDSRQIKATLARASQIALRAPLRGLHRGVRDQNRHDLAVKYREVIGDDLSKAGRS